MVFDFKQSLKLENERVLIRPLLKEDFDFLLPFSLNEGYLWDFSITSAKGAENLKAYINSALDAKEKRTAFPFIVYDKKTSRVAGSTRFYDIDFTHNVLSLGYTWYGKEFQRTGLNRNCKYLLLEYAFEVLQVERVEFRADLRNKKSVNAMEQIGCVFEGVLRSNCKAQLDRRDSAVLSILKAEWVQDVKKNLVNKIY